MSDESLADYVLRVLSDPPVRRTCVRCNVPLLACEIRNEISWCAECWDIAFPNGKATWPVWR